MAKKSWILADDDGKFNDKPTPLSGPPHGLGGYDARNREIASASGGTVTAALLKRSGKHVPKEKPWVKTPYDYKKPLDSRMGEPVEVKKWTKKGYQMIAPATEAAGAKIKLSQHDAGKVSVAFREVYNNVPRTVKATGKTGAAKRKMMTAIALSKAGVSKK
jgi:hypothetical protein